MAICACALGPGQHLIALTRKCLESGRTEFSVVSTTAHRVSSPTSYPATYSGRTPRSWATVVCCAPSHSSCRSSPSGHVSLSEGRSASKGGSRARALATLSVCGSVRSARSCKRRKKSSHRAASAWPANERLSLPDPRTWTLTPD